MRRATNPGGLVFVSPSEVTSRSFPSEEVLAAGEAFRCFSPLVPALRSSRKLVDLPSDFSGRSAGRRLIEAGRWLEFQSKRLKKAPVHPPILEDCTWLWDGVLTCAMTICPSNAHVRRQLSLDSAKALQERSTCSP